MGYAASPEELAKAADAVSVHLASAAETKHLVGKKFLDALAPGSIFINTSRGALVDTQALRAAIAEKGLRVGLDVFEGEPAGGEAAWADKELAAMATCTPHVGASTDQAAEAIAAEVVRIVETFQRTGHPAGAVNLASGSSATQRMVVRHLRPRGRAGGRARRAPRGGDQRRGDGERRFRGAQAACCAPATEQGPFGKTRRLPTQQPEHHSRAVDPCVTVHSAH